MSTQTARGREPRIGAVRERHAHRVARSGPSRSAVPIDREQSFRLIPIIRSGITISLWTGANGTVG